MGALLSLPVLSYFVLPSFGTYATSLNLMFFYMTWSTLVLSNSPLRVELIGTLAAHTLFFLLPATFFLLLDTVIPTLVVDHKIQGAAGLPTRTGRVKGGRKRKGRPLWWQVVGPSLLNIVISVALQAGMELLLTEVLHVRSGLKITRAFPMPWTMARDVLRALAIREVSISFPNNNMRPQADSLFAGRSILHSPLSSSHQYPPITPPQITRPLHDSTLQLHSALRSPPPLPPHNLPPNLPTLPPFSHTPPHAPAHAFRHIARVSIHILRLHESADHGEWDG